MFDDALMKINTIYWQHSHTDSAGFQSRHCFLLYIAHRITHNYLHGLWYIYSPSRSTFKRVRMTHAYSLSTMCQLSIQRFFYDKDIKQFIDINVTTSRSLIQNLIFQRDKLSSFPISNDHLAFRMFNWHIVQLFTDFSMRINESYPNQLLVLTYVIRLANSRL